MVSSGGIPVNITKTRAQLHRGGLSLVSHRLLFLCRSFTPLSFSPCLPSYSGVCSRLFVLRYSVVADRRRSGFRLVFGISLKRFGYTSKPSLYRALVRSQFGGFL